MLESNYDIVSDHIETILPKLKCEPKGCAKYPYLNVVWGIIPTAVSFLVGMHILLLSDWLQPVSRNG